VVVVLGFDNGKGEVGGVVEDIICKLRCRPCHSRAFDQHPALGDINFLSDLQMEIPAGLYQSGNNIFGADIPFGQALLVHSIHSVIDSIFDNPLIVFYFIDPSKSVSSGKNPGKVIRLFQNSSPKLPDFLKKIQ